MCAAQLENVTEFAASPSEVDPQTLAAASNLTTANKRLYLNNVSYQTTEQDLHDLLKDFKVSTILIPSQTVRGFKSLHQKSLGIAYVEFETDEEAERARAQINGKLFYGRALRVKAFVPYAPSDSVSRSNSKRSSHSFLRRSHKSSGSENKEDAGLIVKIQEETANDGDDDDDVADSAEESSSAPIEGSQTPLSVDLPSDNVNPGNQDTAKQPEVKPAVEQPVSDDTVFIVRLSPKTTDGDLREFFHDFSPTDVYIFKTRFKKSQRQFGFHAHRAHVSALVTLSAEGGLSKALVELADGKIKNKKVTLKAAYLTKIEEVKRAAEARQQRLDDIEQEELVGATETGALTEFQEDSNDAALNGADGNGDDSLNVVQDEEDEEEEELAFEQREGSQD